MKEYDIKAPDELYGELFKQVQLDHIFEDSKSFADATPKFHPSKILENYNTQKSKPGFDLKAFVLVHFSLPELYSSGFKSDTSRSAEEHVKILWPYLTRKGSHDHIVGSSLIPIPHDYIVPGGRFGEIYYWDSYFTMLGLALSGQKKMIRNMVLNFAYIIHHIGFIPNGNRSYFASRSQPPFFSLMVQLLAEMEDEDILAEFHACMLKEYWFWMESSESENPYKRLVYTGGFSLNRYWDNVDSPRQEMYGEDIELTHEFPNRKPEELFRDIRSACESGWDFTSRWFADGMSLGTIECSKIIPVDLNCLLWNLENTLSKSYSIKGNEELSEHFKHVAEKRKLAINQVCWNAERMQYEDYHLVNKRTTGRLSLAASFPLFFKIADQEQASKTADLIEVKFLKLGGLISTPYNTGQQWDAPNGWAPLQWMAVKGLDNYGFKSLAREIASRWCTLCEKVYKGTGKFVEKYNVVDVQLLAGGGEYPVQDGFGWSNGVYLKLKEYLKD